MKISYTADDIPGFKPPVAINGKSKHPDLLVINESVLYILELSVAFETNNGNNEDHKKRHYENLLKDLFPKQSFSTKEHKKRTQLLFLR